MARVAQGQSDHSDDLRSDFKKVFEAIMEYAVINRPLMVPFGNGALYEVHVEMFLGGDLSYLWSASHTGGNYGEVSHPVAVCVGADVTACYLPLKPGASTGYIEVFVFM
jgi:hypothetical protein